MITARAAKLDSAVFFFICLFYMVWGGGDILQSLFTGLTSIPMSGREVGFARWPLVFVLVLGFKAVVFLCCIYYAYQRIMLCVDNSLQKYRRWRSHGAAKRK